MTALSKKQQRLVAFVERHDPEKVDGFWWCGGLSWESRDYRVILLSAAQRKDGTRTVEAAEWCGESPQHLHDLLTDAGFLTDPAEEIAVRCESAGRSPLPPPRARSRTRT